MARPEPHLFGWGVAVSVGSSAVLGLLIFLCALALQRPDSTVAPAPLPPDWAVDFPGRIEVVTTVIGRLPWPLPTPVEERQGAGALRWTHRRYELTLPAPNPPDAIGGLLEPVRNAAAGVTVHVTHEAVGALIQIGVDGLLTHTLTLHWLGRQPRVAIVIGDLGSDLLIARALVDIAAPLTLAVVPFRPFSQQVAELGTLFEREVLLQLPEENERNADAAAEQVQPLAGERDVLVQHIAESLAAVPQTIGVSNRAGARFTADRVHMLWILEALKQKQLFWLDPHTSASSVACEVAAAIALPCLASAVALEGDDEAAAQAQFAALPKLARSRGDVIAMGPARPLLLAALRAALPAFAGSGVEVVPLSVIVSDSAPRQAARAETHHP